MGFPYITMGFRIYILSVRWSNRIDENGRIGPCRLLDSRTYPVFDPGGDAGGRGTGHDGLGSVTRRNIGGGAELCAAGVGGCAIVIAVLVEAGMSDTVAPSSAVQFTAFTLETVNAKLSATATCTVTAELIETSTLPDPPNVPPTEMV